MRVLLERLTAPARLVCIGCDNPRAYCEVGAEHLLAPGLSRAVALPSLSLTDFLRRHDGATFFLVAAAEVEAAGAAGLQLFSLSEMAAASRDTVALLHQGIAGNMELADAARARLCAWAGQLLVVGRLLGSQDYLALDPSDSVGGEARVIFLDHDDFVAGITGPDLIRNAWDSFEDFLSDFAAVPEEFLALSWRMPHPLTGESCFLQSVEYLLAP